jgi:hypothetical protein
MEEEAIGDAPRCPEGHVLELLADVTHLFIVHGGSTDLIEEVE